MTLGYCVALANEGGAYLVLGVSDKKPRRAVGTHALENTGKVKKQIFDMGFDRSLGASRGCASPFEPGVRKSAPTIPLLAGVK